MRGNVCLVVIFANALCFAREHVFKLNVKAAVGAYSDIVELEDCSGRALCKVTVETRELIISKQTENCG